MAGDRRNDELDGKTRIVDLKELREELREAEVSFVYEDEEEAEGSGGEEEQAKKKKKIPKAVYRIGIILLALVLALVLWFNRDRLDFGSMVNWVKHQFVGSGEGDGFPVSITGSSVSAANFASANGDAYVLSDTALTVLSSSGKELLSLRHSLNRPVLRKAYNRTLLYNWGGTGYTLLSGTDTVVDGVSDRDILAGDVAQNGRFALGVRGSEGASELNVFQKDGTLQYHYVFARDYITAVALNYDGTHGLVCTVRGEKGGMVSKVTVFDFNDPSPIASYETQENLLIDAYWTEGGDLYAVGCYGLLTAGSSDYAFVENSYQGRQLTAYRLDCGRAFLSVSAYEHAGPCTLLVYRGREEPVRIPASERIVALSASGGNVGALVGSEAVLFDYSTGTELGRADAGNDAKSLTLGSERMAYILGVSEVRTLEMD